MTIEGERRQSSNLDSKLILETESGYGIEKSKDQLFIDEGSMKDIMLVFVAACKSDRIGKMFQMRGGVGHVICSNKNSELDDETTCKFTKALYTKIF